MRLVRCLALHAAIAIVPLGAGTASAVDPSSTLVLYNLASPEGTQIANYYASVYPGVHTFGLSGLGTSESISATDYLSILRPQVRGQLDALANDTQNPVTIDLITTTKGLPLRIQVTQPPPPGFPLPTYTDPGGQQRFILDWQQYSSLESELAAIDTISTFEMMGDQSDAYGTHFTHNPYYQQTNAFSHDAYGSRLTARLDGYTVSDVTDAIDRAQNAFIGPMNSPNGPMHFLIDNDPAQAYDTAMTQLVNGVLTPANMPVTYDATGGFVGTAPGPVIGYDSHGIHQNSTPADYITTGLNITLADGAVFTSIESFNAFSFNVGGYTGSQGQVAQWLQIGGTAGVGNVEEPTATLKTLTNEDLMFQSLLDGKTFAEAAWSATSQVSFVNTFVGDPLMTWRMLNFGDVNRDGFVDISDLAIMGAHWDTTMASGGFGWTVGDMNSDGLVNISDLAILGANWGAVSPWAVGVPETAGLGPSDLGTAIKPYIHGVPEPSSLGMMAITTAALLAYGRLARRRLSRPRDPDQAWRLG